MKVCSECQQCFDDAVVLCTEENHPPLRLLREGSPDMLEGYRIESLVETGVNFATFSARQMASRGTCLVRILSANGSSEQFLHEAKLASAFFHPNVVDVYDAGSLDDGEVFVVSEGPQGRTLREFLNEARVPKLLTTIEIVRQAAEALHALHLCGFTHGAVNPENIIIADDPESGLLVRLHNLDFGRALERSITGNKFIVETALSSLRYFAPEQCSGDATNAQTDVYSLGVVFYEMLAGSPPFDASTATALMHKQKNQPAPDVRIDDFHLRMLVTHSLTESLQKPARLRQATANAFARQLRHIEQLATHVSTPPPAGTVSASKPAPPKFSPAPVFDMPMQEIREPAIAHLSEEPAGIEVENETADNRAFQVEEAIDLEVLDSRPAIEAENSMPPMAEVDVETPIELTLESTNVLELDLIDLPVPAPVDTEEVLDFTVATPIEPVTPSANAAAPARRSRLKHLKKKLHSYTAQIANERPEVEIVSDPSSATETPAIEISLLESTIEDPARELAPTTELAAEPAPLVMAEVEVESIDTPTPLVMAEVRAEPIDAPASEQPEAVSLETNEPESSAIGIEPAELETKQPESSTLQEEPQKVVTGPVRRKRKRAERKKDKIAAVMAAAEPEVVEEPIREIPVIELEPQKVEAAVASIVSTSVAVEKPRKSKAFAAAARSARMQQQQLVSVTHREVDEDEDITLVRPRSRIKVEWAKPRTIYRPDAFSVRYRDEPRFVPTLLEKSAPARVDLYANQEGFLSEQYASTTERTPIPYRTIAICCGVVAVLSVFLFGNDSISRYFQSVSSGDSVTAQATASETAAKPATVAKQDAPKVEPMTVTHIEPAVVRDSVKPSPEVTAPGTVEVPRSVPVKERTLGRTAASPASTIRPDAKTTATTKMPAPAASGKQKPKTEVSKKPVEKAPVVKPEKVVPTTRPRIVQNPRD